MGRALTPAARGLLDTSVVIDPPAGLGDFVRVGVVSTITLAELAYGLHTTDPVQSAAREMRYQRILTVFDPIPYSPTAARVYGALADAVRSAGRNPRPRRFDLLLASVAVDESIPLVTRNPADFEGIHRLVEVISLPA